MQLANSGLGLNLVTFPTARPLEVIDSCAVVPLTSFPADALSLVYMTHADSLSIQAIETFSAFVRGWSATFLEK